ncbi:MAG: SUMF1/EgtB/PvdO family nonheme iron enzyme [Phycisphaerae bacterium]|nr:SUMF1/EgtB/PvdO family nonheme iron enzyme [Phycisphaerae bacterium]
MKTLTCKLLLFFSVLTIALPCYGAVTGVKQGKWYKSPTFKEQNLSVIHIDPGKIDLNAKTEDGKAFWTKRSEWRDKQIYSLVGGDFGDGCAVYLYRTLDVAKMVNVNFGIGSDDGFAFWLDGKQLEMRDVPRSCSPNSDTLKAKLTPGKHEIIFKIQNGAGGAGFWYDISVDYGKFGDAIERLDNINVEALQLAIEDMNKKWPDKYKDGQKYLATIKACESKIPELKERMIDQDAKALKEAEGIIETCRKAMLSNPLLDDQKLILIKHNVKNARGAVGAAIGLPQNWLSNSAIDGKGRDIEIVTIDDIQGKAKVETLYKPTGGKLLTDIDINWDGDKIMFSMMRDSDNLWQLWEMGLNDKEPKSIKTIDYADVDNYDSCYLPDGDIVFTSTAPFTGVPCISGGAPCANLYRLFRKTGEVRRLTFEQDHDWTPTVLNNGRILYQRWEYTDTSHYFTRLTFHSNPDGTEQMEYFGSNSYFPNSFFYARPIPASAGSEHSGKVVGIATGHHGIARSGRILIMDPAKGRRENSPVVQEIPGRGKVVEATIADELVNGVWPQFLHPYPLNENYYLATAKMSSNSLWGIYLVDTFDNMTLIKEMDDAALLEPMVLKATPRPPVIPDKTIQDKDKATVYIADIYEGPGLKGIPKGTVKNIRIYAYHYAYYNNGSHNSLGTETGWDVKRVYGTVPVYADGSAKFEIPANVPISLMPLDENGQALQVMQSWIVGKRGEFVSCIGCHEPQNTAPPRGRQMASRKGIAAIEPWDERPVRPISYRLDVQPVMDKYCVGCHNGSKKDRPVFVGPGKEVSYPQDESYLSLHPYVRRPGPETDYHMKKPMEYHSSTSELIQMLEKGHHNVKLDKQAMVTLCAWAELNAPYHGRWSPPLYKGIDQVKARVELNKLYAKNDDDPENEYAVAIAKLGSSPKPEFIKPVKKAVKLPAIEVEGWPFDEAKAKAKQNKEPQVIDLGNGLSLKMVYVPAGEFVMGTVKGPADETLKAAKIGKGFWMATCEISNAQYNLFDPSHDSRFIDQQWKDHTTPGYAANLPGQPVIRVTYNQAVEYCNWLSQKTGKKFAIPTEAQWEWACRAGSADAMSFGDVNSDFGKYANLADVQLKKMAVIGVNPQPVRNPNRLMDFIPKIESVNDNNMLVSGIGQYTPNAWGLFDMHGNVSEWTSSDFDSNSGRKVVRGGSWRDRPKRATSSFRLGYQPYQPIFNTGIRVIMLDD